ncbi:DUF302 domain-containing protein [Thiolapillus sp.]
MKKLLFVFGILLVSSTQAAQGLVVMDSNHGVSKTMDRLEKVVAGAGFNVIARINHGKAAKAANIDLKPVELLIFGKPKAGSLLMQSQPSTAIDLPMKYVVWEDAGGKVNIGWNDPAWIAVRHGITDKNMLIEKMTGALRKFAIQAAGTD